MTLKKDLTRIAAVAAAEGALSVAVGLPDPMTRALISGGIFAAVQATNLDALTLFSQNRQLSDVVVSALAIAVVQPLVSGEESTQDFVPRMLYSLAAVSAGVFSSDLLYGAISAGEARSVVIS